MSLQAKYTEEKKAETLAYFSATGDNQRKTARDCRIPLSTLQRWISGGSVNDTVTAKAVIKKGELADRLEALAQLLVDAAPDKIAEASLQMVATSLGIAVDKMQLLRNKPTTITDDLSSLSDAELDKRIAAIERGETAKAPKSAPPD